MSVTVIDGGMGTLLARKLGPSDKDPLWSARALATNPEKVIEVHIEFAKAGAQLIRTNSYQASIDGFKEHLNLNEEDSIKLIKKSVELARTAINTFITEQLTADVFMTPPLLVGSIGPYGACLSNGSEYTGDYAIGMTEVELMNWHRPRIKALSEVGIRLLAIETIPALSEALAILRLIKTEFRQMRAWVSFSCKDNVHISEGTNFALAAEECWKLAESQIEAIGVNCIPPAWVTNLLKTVKAKNPKIPLIAYPNSGETWISKQGWVKTPNMKDIKTFVPEWLKLGISYVGGCCRIYPEDIKNIYKEVVNNTAK